MGNSYLVFNSVINNSKLPLIKQAIELVLNDEPMVVAVSEFDDAYEIEMANVSSKDIVRINGRKWISKEQVDKMMDDMLIKQKSLSIDDIMNLADKPGYEYLKYIKQKLVEIVKANNS